MPTDHKTIEAKWQARWRDAGLHHTTLRSESPQVLRARHVPVPVGRGPSRRPLRGLHRHRHHHALEADAGIQRAAPHGLGRVRAARRELRDQARHPPARHDGAGDRQFPPADRFGRIRLRLGPRGQHHRSRVREMDAVDIPEAVRAGAWRTREPSRSTGARRARRGWPTKRSVRAAASAAARSSSARPCASGCCASPATPIGCWRTWPWSTGPNRRWPCSATGSAAAKGPRCCSRARARWRAARSACSRPGPIRCMARPTWCCRPSTRWSTS